MIKRIIFNRLCDELTRPEVNILLGARQVGKTTLLHALQHQAEAQGKATAFFDLEQPQVLAEFNQPDAVVIRKLTQGARVVFIDEFHYLHNASKIFKAIVDARRGVKLICSGSSALAMHQHLKESLAGRRLLFHVYPLSFAELRAARHDASLAHYLRYGGMPGLTHTDTAERQQQLLAELLSAYVLKDVKALVKEDNVRTFNHLLYLLAERQGSTISVHSLANEIGASSNTVNRYLDILEGTFVNIRLNSFSRNLGNELKKSCKTYLYDVGMRNALLKDFSPVAERRDAGALWETLVVLRLHSVLQPNQELRFWRTKDGDEVDVIWLTDRRPLPIEVKSQLPAQEIPKGLRRFLLRYPETRRALVINDTWQGTMTHGRCEVQFLTFEAFDRNPQAYRQAA